MTNIPDHISESLEIIFLVKILKFFDADPGIFFTLDPGMEKIRDKHPGSADTGTEAGYGPHSNYLIFLLAASIVTEV